jgi:hypothetical protein
MCFRLSVFYPVWNTGDGIHSRAVFPAPISSMCRRASQKLGGSGARCVGNRDIVSSWLTLDVGNRFWVDAIVT